MERVFEALLLTKGRERNPYELVCCLAVARNLTSLAESQTIQSALVLARCSFRVEAKSFYPLSIFLDSLRDRRGFELKFLAQIFPCASGSSVWFFSGSSGVEVASPNPLLPHFLCVEGLAFGCGSAAPCPMWLSIWCWF